MCINRLDEMYTLKKYDNIALAILVSFCIIILQCTYSSFDEMYTS